MPKINRRELAFDAAMSKRRKDENGFLHVESSPISKATVNPYQGREIPKWQDLGLSPDGIYYGLRDPDELKKAAGTFNGLPVLLGHYMESAAEPQREKRVGSTGTDAAFEAPYLMQSLSITDKEAIEQIENGAAREISCAYRFDPDMTAGEYDGVNYDFVIRNIRGNHVALVEDGRAGPDVAVADSMPKNLKTKGRNDMKKNKGKNKTFMQSAVIAMDEAIEEAAKDEDPKPDETAKDEGESIDEIVDKLLPDADGEKKAVLKSFLLKLKGEVETAPGAMDEDETAKDEDPAAEEAVKDEDSNPEKTAADEDTAKDEEGETAAAMDRKTVYSSKMAMDAKTVQDIKTTAKKETIAEMRSLATAAKKCSPLVGSNLDAFAFDSADDIYAKALQLNGVNPKEYPKSAYKGMVDMMLKNAPAVKQGAVAFDALPSAMKGNKEVDNIFKNLDRIDVQ